MAFYKKNGWDTFATVLPELFNEHHPKDVIDAIINQLDEKRIFADLDSENHQDLTASIKVLESAALGINMNFHPTGTTECASIRDKAIRAYKEAASII